MDVKTLIKSISEVFNYTLSVDGNIYGTTDLIKQSISLSSMGFLDSRVKEWSVAMSVGGEIKGTYYTLYIKCKT